MLLKHLLLALGALELAAAFALPGTAGGASQNPNKKTCKKPNVRKEWRTLNPSEKRNYISAVSCLANTPKNPAHTSMPGATSMFDEFQGVHVQQTDEIHFVGHFIQWHRYMLDKYEKALQEHCGLRGGMPYWDWTIDAASGLNMPEYPLFSPTNGLGGNGPFEEAGPDVFFQIANRTGGGCVQDGPFTYSGFSLSLDLTTGLEVAAPHCLRRDFVPDLITFNLNAAAVDVVLDSPDFWWFSRNMEGFASFEIPNIHGGGHFGIGGSLGTMGNPYYSPGDPLFYLHHGNLDRVYWEWQKRDKVARMSAAGGVGANIVPWDYEGIQGNVTADFPIHMGEIAGVKRIDELLDIQGGPFCYKYDTDKYN